MSFEIIPQSPQQTEGFFGQNQHVLDEFSDAFDCDWQRQPEVLVEHMQQWVQNPAEMEMTPRREAAIWKIFDGMNMRDEIQGPGGMYDQVLIFGAKMHVTEQRTACARTHLTRETDPAQLKPDGKIVFLGSERIRRPTEGNAVAEVIYAANNATDAWLHNERAKSRDERIATETACGRLSLVRHFGDLHLQEVVIGSDGHVEDMKLKSPTLTQEIILLNGRSVTRDVAGEPRTTTESEITEWAQRHVRADIPQRALVVAGNPYQARMMLASKRVLRAMGIDNITLEGCGPASPEGLSPRAAVREFAKRLWDEALVPTAIALE
jgi:hypothetical protein